MYRIIKGHSVNVNAGAKYLVKVNEGPQEAEAAAVHHDVPDYSYLAAEAEREAAEKANAVAEGIMDNATREAGKIVSSAKEEAGRIIRDGQEELEKERTAVLLAASQKGYDEGYHKGNTEAQLIINDAKILTEKTNNERQQKITELEPSMVDLIIKIIQKLIDDTVKVNPQVVLHLIRQGLAQSSNTCDITLRVSKDDYDFCLASKDEILTHIEGGANLDILRDFSLGQGDCMIETPYGVIDSSLDMQFDEIKQNLRFILEGET